MRTALLLLAAGVGTGFAQDVVFRSDVALIRVDAQVVDRQNRAITTLEKEDFLLREDGAAREIRGFSTEEIPVDVLLLVDVSGSMRWHVERLASAAREALAVLGGEDRVAIMAFDRTTRLRLPFRGNREQVAAELRALLDDEGFNGGTDITRALMDASAYISREGRREARRAIVILTDDQTERGRDEDGVSRALARAETVLSALLVPDAMGNRAPAGAWPGGPLGGPLGGIVLGRRRGPIGIGSRTQSAGTAEIARRSGGDSMRSEDASSLETTLARIRQRYALFFYLPEGAAAGQERQIEVELASAARRRHPDAAVRSRRVYMTPGNGGETVVSQAPAPPQGAAVGEDRSVAQPPQQTGGWRRADEPEKGGWRRLGPGEKP